MKRFKYYITGFVFTIFLASCVNDLDVKPIDPDEKIAEEVYTDENSFKEGLAKLYATYAVSGQQGGGGGKPDIAGIDENFGNYLRQYWGVQELSTDEAIMAWDDATIKNFHWHTWAPNDVFISAIYSRIYYTISLSNEFIRNTRARVESESGSFAENLQIFEAEARFLRAFSYWHAIDLFGNVPFVDEDDLPGAFSPERILRADLFNYVEGELKELENLLPQPMGSEYGRVDRAAVWMLLAKLYMNAEVYTGTERYTDALTYINNVIGSSYSFDNVYADIFRADNNLSPEIIFPITFDGANTQQYGGMTFLLHASNGGGMPLYDLDGGWGGIRTIKEFVGLFNVVESDFNAASELTTTADKRALFYFNPENWQWEVENVGTFTEGIGVLKYKNVTSTGGTAPNGHPAFVSVDFPVFRLSDAFLMYAEAVLRGGTGGDRATALGYINQIQERAYGNASNNLSDADMTLDFILDERARELYWEAHRRTDLIRFNKFTGGDYVWTWKGKVKEGTSTPAYRNLYPIPTNDMTANPNLVQNDGYN